MKTVKKEIMEDFIDMPDLDTVIMLLASVAFAFAIALMLKRRQPTQEIQEQDPFHHLRHLPPEVVEEYICRLEATCRECIPVEETGSLDPHPLERENYPQLILEFSPTCTPI